MFQTIPKTITFEEFLDWYPDGYGCYEQIFNSGNLGE